MTIHFEERFASHPSDVKHYDTQQLREHFLIEKVMEADKIHLVYSHYDRYIAGGAVPVNSPLELTTIEPLKAPFFCYRRELGIINVGGKGTVTVDGKVYSMDFKEALYIGKGSGMAIAKTLGAAGAKICVNDLSDEKLEACKIEYAKVGLDVFTLNFDVTNEEAVDKGITIIEKEVGHVDILVNNAGIIKRVPILDMAVSDFKLVLDIDLVAPLIIAKRVAPGMIARRFGKIINMCSMMSVYGRNSVSAYASAKGGLKLLTANMCCEWAKYNVQINGIGPGYIATSQTADIRLNGHPFNDLVMTRTPAGRWGEPEDVGNAALFLASKASDFVNGHVLYVDGGILANFGYVKGENEI